MHSKAKTTPCMRSKAQLADIGDKIMLRHRSERLQKVSAELNVSITSILCKRKKFGLPAEPSIWGRMALLLTRNLMVSLAKLKRFCIETENCRKSKFAKLIAL